MFYVKDVDSDFVFKQLKEVREKPVQQLARQKVNGRMINRRDEDGNLIYREKLDKTIDNVWRIPCLQPADKTQRMGYPTQKPEALLARIIEASSKEGQTVLDPFCGCGTTVAVAQLMNRQWVGIDITHLAIGLVKYRLLHRNLAKAGVDYSVTGEPTTFEGAVQLAKDDRHQFEHWALGLVGARASAKGKGADKGIDGSFLFQEGGTGSTVHKALISVKSGKVSVKDVRDIRAVREREEATLGILITLESPSRDMKREAANSPFFESPWGKHQVIQILTVQELLSGKQIDCPPVQKGGSSFKLPKRADLSKPQDSLFED